MAEVAEAPVPETLRFLTRDSAFAVREKFGTCVATITHLTGSGSEPSIWLTVWMPPQAVLCVRRGVAAQPR
eukprot:COSAG04_NODE_3371_length_2880_cov_7.944984_5_plen_70_part_01